MVSLEAVRSANANLKALGPDLVAIFVGGTSGIGESAAREFVRNADSPRLYLVGRNQDEASRIQKEFEILNPKSQFKFIQSDISLLKNVDKVCSEIQAQEPRINLLFMSPGYLTLSGRDETIEGLDKKFNLNYYSRLRFTQNLMPQLTAAAKAGQLSRQVSVLGAGHEGKLELDDLSLKKNFSTSKCANHATCMNSLVIQELAAKHPDTSFVHISPGAVKTNVLRELGLPNIVKKGISLLATPFSVAIGESGERNCFAATSPLFGPQSAKPKGMATGTGRGLGGGAHLLNWEGEATGNQKILGPYRDQGVAELVYKHTMDVFDKVCTKGEKW